MSLTTNCQVLFAGSVSGPLDDIQLLMTKDSLNAKHVKRIENGIDTLRRVADGAQPYLATQVRAMANEAQLFLDDAYDADAPARDTTA